jgi:hypothetical protein
MIGIESQSSSLNILEGLGFCLEVDHFGCQFNGHDYHDETGPACKKSKCKFSGSLADLYHPIEHTHCSWAPVQEVQVLCKVGPSRIFSLPLWHAVTSPPRARLYHSLSTARTRRRGRTPGCLSVLWMVQILSLYEKRHNQGIPKKMTAPRRHARRTFITPHTPETPQEKEISPRRHPRCCHPRTRIQACTPAYGHA